MSRTCIECDGPAVLQVFDAYGTGKPGDYCDICYMSDYRRDELEIATSVLGVDSYVVVLADDEQCVNCDAYLMAPGARKSEETASALVEYEKQMKSLP